MKRFSPAFLLAGLFLVALPAAAQGRPVVVVEVTGDVDPRAVREAVASELGAEVVAPTDARAREAARTVLVAADATAKQLTVSLRTTNAPVARTVRLPDDTTAWPKTVRFLAGNLARDEAGAILADLKKPEPAPVEAPAPAPPASPVVDPEVRRELVDGDRLARVRAYVDLRARDEGSEKTRIAGALLVPGLVAVGAGTYLMATEGDAPDATTTSTSLRYPTTREGIGLSLVTVGAAFTIVSGLVALGTTPHQELKTIANEELGDETKPAAERVAAFEKRWKARADESRVNQKTWSVVLMAVGGAALGGAVTLQAALGDEDSLGTAVFAGAIGTTWAASGIFGYASRTPFERSYDEYRTLASPRPAQAAVSRPSVGVAPTRGGAMAGLSFTF